MYGQKNCFNKIHGRRRFDAFANRIFVHKNTETYLHSFWIQLMPCLQPSNTANSPPTPTLPIVDPTQKLSSFAKCDDLDLQCYGTMTMPSSCCRTWLRTIVILIHSQSDNQIDSNFLVIVWPDFGSRTIGMNQRVTVCLTAVFHLSIAKSQCHFYASKVTLFCLI